jgi:hypothetical protein
MINDSRPLGSRHLAHRALTPGTTPTPIQVGTIGHFLPRGAGKSRLAEVLGLLGPPRPRKPSEPTLLILDDPYLTN